MAKAAKKESKAIVKKKGSKVTPISSKANQCRERIERAVINMTTNFVDLSTAMLEAYDNDYASEWGFPNFKEYVEGHLGLKYRKCMYWVNGARAIRELNLDPEQINKIGWTRFKEIAPILLEEPRRQKELLKMAENLSSRQLQEKLREEPGIKQREGKPASAGVMRMSAKFEGDAMSVVSDGLNLAYSELGIEDISAAVQHIVSEWLMTKGTGGQNVSLEDWLNYLEKTYSVKLVKAELDDSLESILTDDATQEAEAGGGDDELESLLGGSGDEEEGDVDDDLEALLS